MKALTFLSIAAIAVTMLTACATETDYQNINKQMMNDQLRTPEQDCAKYGFSPGSSEYQKCISETRSCMAQQVLTGTGFCID